eukprot:CAMPEP_0194541316 /NCGR_PEP_ID=MMETSP0253-20130528/81997_1 /TAXON_ID=2966 /ORGANISM="Noctiluca scintillans" /LENGTH=62 /DNA_ID=CAMNT_0039387789 /DNA_START=221 /DNA_END=410 /DNA_ORIENTATION=-
MSSTTDATQNYARSPTKDKFCQEWPDLAPAATAAPAAPAARAARAAEQSKHLKHTSVRHRNS